METLQENNSAFDYQLLADQNGRISCNFQIFLLKISFDILMVQEINFKYLPLFLTFAN